VRLTEHDTPYLKLLRPTHRTSMIARLSSPAMLGLYTSLPCFFSPGVWHLPFPVVYLVVYVYSAQTTGCHQDPARQLTSCRTIGEPSLPVTVTTVLYHSDYTSYYDQAQKPEEGPEKEELDTADSVYCPCPKTRVLPHARLPLISTKSPSLQTSLQGVCQLL